MAVSPYSAVTALIWAALGVLLGRAALRREPETAALIFLLAAVRLLAPLETVGCRRSRRQPRVCRRCR